MRVFIVGSFVVACTAKVSCLPKPGESLAASAFASEPGGKGFNLALACHRLGAEVDGLFAVGNDAFAQIAAATFADLGFVPDMLLTRAGSTGAGIGLIDAHGENCIAVCLGANLALEGEAVRRAAARVQRADLVAATFESPDEPIREAFALARARGIRTLLNPSPYRPIDPGILADTSVLVVNAVEAASLGLPDAAAPLPRTRGAFATLLRKGPEMLIVTLGSRGAIAFGRADPPHHQPAFPVEAVDTVGAGDAFAAGFLVSVLEDRPVASSLQRAAACGALTVSRFGTFAAFPTGFALEAFLEPAESAG